MAWCASTLDPESGYAGSTCVAMSGGIVSQQGIVLQRRAESSRERGGSSEWIYLIHVDLSELPAASRKVRRRGRLGAEAHQSQSPLQRPCTVPLYRLPQ